MKEQNEFWMEQLNHVASYLFCFFPKNGLHYITLVNKKTMQPESFIILKDNDGFPRIIGKMLSLEEKDFRSCFFNTEETKLLIDSKRFGN